MELFDREKHSYTHGKDPRLRKRLNQLSCLFGGVGSKSLILKRLGLEWIKSSQGSRLLHPFLLPFHCLCSTLPYAI